MPTNKSILDALEESIEDIKIINDFYCENGAEGIVEMVPPVKYLLASISDILNDNLSNKQAGFYSFFKEFSHLLGPINNKWDDFDKGLIWIIQKLNSKKLRTTIDKNYETIRYYYKPSALIIKKKESILELLSNLEESVKFLLHQEDLYTSRIRFTPKETSKIRANEPELPAENSPISDISEPLDHSNVMTSSFISMEAIDVKLLQERELRNDFGFVNKLKYNSMRFINNFRISSKLKPHRSDFDFSVTDDDFESINIYSKEKDEESIPLDFDKMEICPEKGLIAQNYLCPDCGNGISSKDSIKCDFSGSYMCPKCHGNEKSINPLRILKSWDFQRYPVSRKSKQLIAQLSYNYLINFPKLNPKEFYSNEKFKNIQIFREKIVKSAQKRLKAAGKLDGPKQFALLEKIAWPKTHLLTSTDLYTIEDLIEIENGKFYHSVLLPLYNLLKL